MALDNKMFDKMIDDHMALADRIRSESPTVMRIAELVCSTLQSGGKILIAGNGGSAADAQHIAAEFVGRFKVERVSLPAIALTTDTSILTAIGNDYGYDQVFVRQIEGLCTKKDCFIGVSTSGNSPNVVKAFQKAREIGAHTIGLAGRSGGVMSKDCCDELLVIPSADTARIQEMHIFVGHVICEIVDSVSWDNE